MGCCTRLPSGRRIRCHRITAYADRLLDDLEGLDWSESIKEMQRNWIGKSVGAEVHFGVQGQDGAQITGACRSLWMPRCIARGSGSDQTSC